MYSDFSLNSYQVPGIYYYAGSQDVLVQVYRGVLSSDSTAVERHIPGSLESHLRRLGVR